MVALLNGFLIRFVSSILDSFEARIIDHPFVTFLHEFLGTVVKFQQGVHGIDDVLANSRDLGLVSINQGICSSYGNLRGQSTQSLTSLSWIA